MARVPSVQGTDAGAERVVVDVRAGEDARACRAAWRLDDHEASVSSLPENSELMYKRKTTILRVQR